MPSAPTAAIVTACVSREMLMAFRESGGAVGGV